MGLITRTFSSIFNVASFAPIAITSFQSGQPQFSDGKYLSFAREGYQANELVYAGIEELATSAAEPTMVAELADGSKVTEGWRRWDGSRWIHGGGDRLIALLNQPNPFMDRFSFFAHVIMFLYISGNAYGLIIRSASGQPVELWLMRPDRVRIVPDRARYIARYEYDSGEGAPTPLPVEDVIHWKKRSPTDDFYGQSPLLAGSGRIDMDNYMKKFVTTFFERHGMPSGLLNVEGEIDDNERTEIRAKFARDYAGPRGWHNLMVISKKKASFTPLTVSPGTNGLVVPELDEIAEARILMLVGVPPELIAARVGMRNSSYANKRSARESFWDETLSPLYVEMDGPVNLRLTPNFPQIRRVSFDLSHVRALQEDEDKVHDRVRKDLAGGILGVKESRLRLGLGDIPTDDLFYSPTTGVLITGADLLAGRMPEPASAGGMEGAA